MKKLLQQIRSCENCIHFLPCPPRPVIQAGVAAKILIIGQAPGAKVQASGIPWDDASGNELRRWLGVDKEQFYNPNLFVLMPMGFCYPGKGKSGDKPPRPECAPLWHNKVLAKLKNVQLTLLIGQYAQNHYLLNNSNATLTDTVKNYKKFLPEFLPLVHPSPRNRIWQKKNPWFEKKIVPYLQEATKEYL
jgi:uracil-DNA glycosylase